jgi:phage gpG-like protein
MLLSTSTNFRTETDPEGRPWTPLRPATVRARTRKKQLPLTILRSNTRGKAGSSLAGSVNRQASDDELRIGSPVAYAAIHQLGGTIQKPAGSRWMAGRRFARRAGAPDGKAVAIAAHAITIPARPFLGLSDADEAAILDEAERWLYG